jgi:hypothetical protein
MGALCMPPPSALTPELGSMYVRQTHVAVVAARQGSHIDSLPTAIVCIGVRPVWVIAGMESPGAIEQSSCGAQRRRIRPAAARQIGDHDGQCHQRRYDDTDDQFALCCVGYLHLQ